MWCECAVSIRVLSCLLCRRMPWREAAAFRAFRTGFLPTLHLRLSLSWLLCWSSGRARDVPGPRVGWALSSAWHPSWKPQLMCKWGLFWLFLSSHSFLLFLYDQCVYIYSNACHFTHHPFILDFLRLFPFSQSMSFRSLSRLVNLLGFFVAKNVSLSFEKHSFVKCKIWLLFLSLLVLFLIF